MLLIRAKEVHRGKKDMVTWCLEEALEGAGPARRMRQKTTASYEQLWVFYIRIFFGNNEF